MKKRLVVSGKCLQVKSPLSAGLLWWLALEHFVAPGWLYGVVGCIWALWLIAFIVDVVNTEQAVIPGFGDRAGNS